jgi:hypothetical protein
MGKFGKSFTPPKVTIIFENPEKALGRKNDRSTSVSGSPEILLLHKIFDNFTFCKN